MGQKRPRGSSVRSGIIVSVLVMPFMLIGCASDPVIPLPPEKPEVASAVVRPTVDAETTREHKKLLAAFGGEYRNNSAQALIDDTVNRLAPATNQPDLRYRVTVLNSSTVNAFALPSGSIYVTRGLLVLANSTSELSSVLAHEMAHVTARHAIERAELERRTTLVSRVNSDLLNDPRAGQVRQDEGRVAIASFSRQQELEADQVGVRTVSKAGYDAYGASRFLNSLGRSSILRGRNTRNSQVDFLSTHPTTPERIEAALFAAKQLSTASNISPEKEQADRNRYLAAINGMVFGDNPSDGVVRDETFLHPRLGFAFTAPDNFALENSAQAVLGLKPGGQQALRFESVRIVSGTSLTEYLNKSPIKGAPTSRVETQMINGYEAITAIANSDEWTYRVLVIRKDDKAYRMILAAQNFTPEVETQFSASFKSFRSLTQAEAQGLGAQKISIITAQSGDTASSLAARMGGSLALEKFLVLNGLSTADDFKANARYKIIS